MLCKQVYGPKFNSQQHNNKKNGGGLEGNSGLEHSLRVVIHRHLGDSSSRFVTFLWLPWAPLPMVYIHKHKKVLKIKRNDFSGYGGAFL